MEGIYVFLIIFFGFFFVLAYFGITFALNYVGKSRIFDIQRDAPDVINLLPSLANGFSKGREFTIKQFPNGRTLVSFYPTDQIIKDFGEKQEEFEIPEFVLEKGMRLVIPKGDLSTRRDQVYYLPTDPNYLPRKFRETPLGMYIANYIINQRKENTIGETMEEAMKEIEKASKYHKFGIISQQQVKQILDITELKEKRLLAEPTVKTTKENV